jgi:nitrite reductase/ring-hydroxylating ferredoxin subunit
MSDAPNPSVAPAVSAKDGSAYGRKPASSVLRLQQVGPGTPCGEWMRRYWQPVLTSAHVTSRPQVVRLLGEDLVVFRDKSGRVGLLYPRCMHRGTSLMYGKVDERGIRCCYHGWLFDVEGKCLEQPCEPKGGLGRAAARQPWYPTEERYGMVFAYMGPPERKPVLPRYDILEDLEPDEHIIADDGELFGMNADRGMPMANYNWLQASENTMDPFHVQVLHSTFTGHQFAPEFEIMPKVEWSPLDPGMIYRAHRKFDDGREVDRVTMWIPACAASIPNITLTESRSDVIAWFAPVDDTHTRGFVLARTKLSRETYFDPIKLNGKTWVEMTPEERRDFPGDYEAQSGQGVMNLHSDEHLVTSDRGVVMVRRLIEKQIQMVEQGRDPPGVAFDEASALIRVPAGNFFGSGGA